MFSYRHAFHVGNHGDVLKHIVFTELIRYYQQKEKGVYFIDTHAGAGVYHLDDEWCQKKSEFLYGYYALKTYTETTSSSCPTLVQNYLHLIESIQGDDPLLYPGSPWIAMSLLRPQDRLRLFEWHPSEIDVLKSHIMLQDRSIQKQTQVFHQNSFKGLKALLPPPTKRAVVLMDPAYENKQDYFDVVKTITQALKRFSTGCYAIWYPITKEQPWQQMIQSLIDLNPSYLDVQLQVPLLQGLNASGVFIINPPYSLEKDLQNALPYIESALNTPIKPN